MNQQELEALLAKMGALGPGDFTEETKIEEVPNPKSTANGGDENVAPTMKGPVVYRSWVKPGTNIRLTVKVNDDGSYTKTHDGADSTIKPDAGARPQTVATSPTEEFIVTRNPDGTITSSKNPNYVPPKPDKPAAPHITTFEGNLVSIDPATNKVTILSQGTPKEPVLVDLGDGRKGHATIGADGKVVITEVKLPPPASAGPTIPQMVLGHATEAMTTLLADIKRRVSTGEITQAQGDKAWAEINQVAQVTMQEATIAQRERESNLNASVNLATTKLNSGQDALKTAMTLVNSINDKLPVGSDLGGKAFAAMVGLSLMNQQRSGIDDIKPPTDQTGQRLSAAATAATNTTDQQIGRLTAPPAATPPPAPVPPPTPPVAPPVAAQGAAAPAAPVAPPAASSAPLPGPNPATPNLTPPPPEAPSAVPNNAPNGAWAPPPAQPGDPGWNTLRPGQAPPPSDWETDDVMVQSTDDNGQPNGQPVRMTRAEWEQLQAESNAPPTPSWNPLTNLMTPTPTKKQYIVTPVSTPRPVTQPTPGISVPVNAPSTADPNSMAPHASDFAVLAPYMPQQQPGAPMATPGVDMRQNPALLHAQAASTPLWRMSPDQYQQYVAAGVPEDVIRSTPGGVTA